MGEMLTVVRHPLARVHLTALRDEHSEAEQFRHHLLQLTRIMAYLVFNQLHVQTVSVTTPLGESAPGAVLARPPVLVPVLRAGLGMVEGLIDLVPGAVVSHLGLYRDEKTLTPKPYYKNFPESARLWPFFILDPMLATGGSAIEAIDYLRSEGAEEIVLVSIISAVSGIERVFLHHPSVPIFTCAVDEKLNERGYILPGLGDAGDRQFGTGL